MLDARSSLVSYLDDLQAEGRITFTRDEAVGALGITEGAFLKSSARLQKRHKLFNPRQGFYVVVPPQFLSWQAPPPAWYIDQLMQHEGRPYYVGLLKAAELHGATHHAVMEFQIVTDRQIRRIRAGRSWITFHFRKDMKPILAGIDERKTDTGKMKLSSPELTALDLVRYIHVAGGMDAVATILRDLGNKVDGHRLADLAPHFDRACVQRLGYLLDRLGHNERAKAIYDQLHETNFVPWVALEPMRRDGVATPSAAPAERNERWRVLVQREPEVDE
ncbi:type IV toxin-antitoxin system AbiEi family antitoxin domain-containing protein [Bradyrhizobium campsiandrae]|nr:type IV toxin-antitoxin system AbiEi family antitoxin [Bradyrhizobium campsiandrae]